jgi:chorismate mutase
VAGAVGARSSLTLRSSNHGRGEERTEFAVVTRLTSLDVRLQALRGAITCDEDSKIEIDSKVSRLVNELFSRNALNNDDVVSIIFTATPDLTAQFPATSARVALDLGDIALLGAQEQAVPHGTPRCVRVLVHCYSDRPRSELQHVFLDGAAALREDLTK